jgi:hypothetical protein
LRSWIPCYGVERTPHATTAGALQVRVDHSRLDVRVTQELLDRPDVISILEKVRGEGVSEGVTTCVLVDAHLPNGLLYCSLHRRLVEMMPPLSPASGIGGQPRRGEEVLPREFMRGTPILALEGVGHPDLTAARGEILSMNSSRQLHLITQRLLKSVGQHGK